MILSLLSLVLTANAVTTDPLPVIQNNYGKVYTKQQIGEIVNYYATKYNVDADKMINTINCESQFSNIQSNIVQNGIRENSWGLVQINLYYNPTVTKEQALDPYFSIEWMAKEFSTNHQSKWTCFRNLYGR